MRKLVLVLFLVSCATENRVRNEIDEANYCSEVEDCVNLGSYCPFGCYVLVNKNEQEQIEDLLADYDKQHRMQCMYDCMSIGGLDCVGGKCITLEYDTGY